MDATTASPPIPNSNEKRGTDTIVGALDGDYWAGAQALWRILKMCMHYWVRFTAAIAAVIAAGVFQLLIPRYLGRAVDHATGLLSGSTAATCSNPKKVRTLRRRI